MKRGDWKRVGETTALYIPVVVAVQEAVQEAAG